MSLDLCLNSINDTVYTAEHQTGNGKDGYEWCGGAEYARKKS
jgi:hypothetical protein